MKVVAVGGLSKGVGKTSLCTLLLKYFKDAAAVKITHFHEGPLPSWAVPCEPMEYVVIRDDALLRRKGTDTGRMSETTSGPVRWLQCGEKGLEEGLNGVLEELSAVNLLICEGNSFFDIRKADLGIMVAKEGMKEAKEHAVRVIRRVDLLAVNSTERISSGMRKWLVDLCPGKEQLRFNPLDEADGVNGSMIKRIADAVGF